MRKRIEVRGGDGHLLRLACGIISEGIVSELRALAQERGGECREIRPKAKKRESLVYWTPERKGRERAA